MRFASLYLPVFLCQWWKPEVFKYFCRHFDKVWWYRRQSGSCKCHHQRSPSTVLGTFKINSNSSVIILACHVRQPTRTSLSCWNFPEEDNRISLCWRLIRLHILSSFVFDCKFTSSFTAGKDWHNSLKTTISPPPWALQRAWKGSCCESTLICRSWSTRCQKSTGFFTVSWCGEKR